MGHKYYCVVNKDKGNNELELVHASDYDTVLTANTGSVQFSDKNQMNSYFNQNCISENEIENKGNNLFMFLFFILLIILLIALLCQIFNRPNGAKNMATQAATQFGRFNF